MKRKKKGRSKSRRSGRGMEMAALGLLVLAAGGLGIFALTRSSGGGEGLEIQGGLTMSFGVRGEGPGQFSSPRGISAGPEGFAVADPGRDKVLLFDSQGRFESEFSGEPDSKPYGILVDPHGVSRLADGNLIVADPRALRVFNRQGEELKGFDGEQLGFYSPRAIAYSAEAGFFVADTGNGRVGVLNPDGEKTQHFGPSEGDAFKEPKAVAALRNGNVAVSDKDHRVYIFKPDGSPVKTIKIPQSSGFGPSQEHALAEAPDGTLAVADPEAHRIRLFDAEGKVKGWVARASAGDLVEDFVHPMGVAFLQDGRLAVADATLGKVFVLRLVP